MGMSVPQLLLVLLIVLLLFGAGRLPAVMADLAKGLRAFRKGMDNEDSAGPALSGNLLDEGEARKPAAGTALQDSAGHGAGQVHERIPIRRAVRRVAETPKAAKKPAKKTPGAGGGAEAPVNALASKGQKTLAKPVRKPSSGLPAGKVRSAKKDKAATPES
jgi:sec-independent protein translocase protein TatA